MRRLICVLFPLLLLGGCGGGSPPAAFVFPAAVDSWKLKQEKDLPPAEAFEQARRLGLKRVQIGEYEGTGRLEAEVYTLTSDAAALELEQTWKPAADTVAFHQGAGFAVIRWQNASRASVTSFVREMEKRVGR